MEEKSINLLVVIAHPDDEIISAGVLIRAKEMGFNTHLVCATRGEACRVKNREVMNENNKIEVRTKELQESCKVIGVTTLNFLELADSKGSEWDKEVGEKNLSEVFHRIKPDIIITLPKDGGNGHPDHKAISALTVNVFNDYKLNNIGSLYFLTPYPESLFKSLLIAKVLPKKIKEKVMKMATTKDENVTAVIKLTSIEVKKKFLALEKHRSQFPDEKGRYYGIPKVLFKMLSKYECYGVFIEQGNNMIKKYKSVDMIR